jgi:membrane protease YdiL (CAAX protease family)
MSAAALSPRRFLAVCGITIAMGVGLGELYEYTQGAYHLTPWRAALAAHAVLGLILLVVRKPTRESLRLAGAGWLAYLPGCLIIAGAVILSRVGSQAPQPFTISSQSELIYIVCTLTLIPLFEEIVFRSGISPFLGRFADGWWAVWFSAVVFSLAHTAPSVERVLSFSVGLPLGPFFLGICCDMIVRRWGRLWPAVFFHACCNGTVYIFSSLNPSWLAKLGQLYM